MSNWWTFCSIVDHGYSLGQHGIPMDKRHVYDWHTRIPFFAAGPGVASGSAFAAPATVVDLAPTILELAGIGNIPAPSALSNMDGHSFAAFLLTNHTDYARVPTATATSLGLEVARTQRGPTARQLQRQREQWRDQIFLQHYFVDENVKCLTNCTVPVGVLNGWMANPVDVPCVFVTVYDEDDDDDNDDEDDDDDDDGNADSTTPTMPALCWCRSWSAGEASLTEGCHNIETVANNFIALRTLSGWRGTDANDNYVPETTSELYAEFQTGDSLFEDVRHKNICPRRGSRLLNLHVELSLVLAAFR